MSHGQESVSGALSSTLPIGTVTFLYTDIEGSTKRWESDPTGMKAAVEWHDAILREAIGSHNGVVFRTMGDAFCAAFPVASDALRAAISAQRRLSSAFKVQSSGSFAGGELEHGTLNFELRVRMALHSGLGEVRDGDYVGQPLNRVARLLATCNGGQTILSQAVYELVRDSLPPGASLVDMGEHRLKDLLRPEHIYQVVVPDLPSAFPPLKTLDTRPNNLPVQPTLFVGREAEIEEVCEIVRRPDTRLLTLTGPGGTGKTRLALQVATTLLDDFSEGAYYAPLSTITDDALVLPTIAQTLGVPENVGRPVLDTLKDYLRDKRILLVLDNFEHLVDAAPMLAELIRAASGLKVLVTSRSVLRIYGEREFPVPPLALPDPKHLPTLQNLRQYEAVRLFVERAMSARPDFELTQENAPAVAEICCRLDGLPLAIELAAARVKLLSPQAMLPRLSSRLKLLTGGARDLPARQQTLRNAIEWGYDLLEEEEKTLFRRLGIFVGGCTLEAAESVVGSQLSVVGVSGEPTTDYRLPAADVLDGLASLVDKSLLRQGEGPDEEPRFAMLETIREYAVERLDETGERDAMQRAHAQYYAELAERGEKGIRSPQESLWADRLDADLDNFRAALEWGLSEARDKELALRIVAGLWEYWHLRAHVSEGYRWTTLALSATTDLGETRLRGRALFGAGYMCLVMGDAQKGSQFMTESRTISEKVGDDVNLARSTDMLGAFMIMTGDPSGIELGRRAIELDRKLEAEDPFALGEGLMSVGIMYFLLGDIETAISLMEESNEKSKRAGDKYITAQSTNYLGDLMRVRRNYERAGPLYEEALERFREINSTTDVPALLHNLAYVAIATSDFDRAKLLLAESLAMHKELGNVRGIAEFLAGMAALASAQNEMERAAVLFGATNALRQRIGASLWPAERIECERNEADALSRTGESIWAAGWQRGQQMSTDDAVAFALTQF